MKRMLLMLSLAMFLALGVGAGVASANHGPDYAKGNVLFFQQKWDFDARSSFNGNNPEGRIRVTYQNVDPNVVVTAEVTCLRVVNGLFQARGEVTDVNGPSQAVFGVFPPSGVILNGSDTGKFSPDPDTFSGSVIQEFPGFPPPDFDVCGSPGGGSPVQDGQIIVHDS